MRRRSVGEVGQAKAMSVHPQKRLIALTLGSTIALGALALSAINLAGCSSTIADLPAIGAPADAPDRPKEPGSYLPVHDLPPDRDDPIIPADQRAKIEAELIAARDRQALAAQSGSPQSSAGQGSTGQSSAAK